MAFVAPPVWSRQDLAAERSLAEGLFREQRRDEGPRAFTAACAALEPRVRHALAVTDDLRDLAGALTRDPDLWQVLRYFCAPPISEEDLWTLVGGPKFGRVPPPYVDATADAIAVVIDAVRFPWVEARRSPSDIERDAAVLATTCLMAARVVGTTRRGDASKRQEAAVASALETAGFELDASRARIDVLDVLGRGAFSRERRVAGAKCDVPVRLLDGRLLALECKVSNGPKNGWKRVNREVGGKAEHWRQQFGSQVVTAVVLAGVLDLACVEAAQGNQGVVIFWEHDLTPLSAFVAAARAG